MTQLKYMIVQIDVDDNESVIFNKTYTDYDEAVSDKIEHEESGEDYVTYNIATLV